MVTVALKEMSYLQVPSNSCKSVQLDVISESPPLLGSPYSCGIWSPLRSRLPSPSTVSITSSEGNLSEQDQLLIVPELKRINEDKVFLDIYYGFRGLQCRLDVLLDDVRKMKIEAQSLSHSFEVMYFFFNFKRGIFRGTRQFFGGKFNFIFLLETSNKCG